MIRRILNRLFRPKVVIELEFNTTGIEKLCKNVFKTPYVTVGRDLITINNTQYKYKVMGIVIRLVKHRELNWNVR